jgi:hypothetical protein
VSINTPRILAVLLGIIAFPLTVKGEILARSEHLVKWIMIKAVSELDTTPSGTSRWARVILARA